MPLISVLSERDVLRQVLASGRDPVIPLVVEVATPDPVAVRADATIKQCTALIRQVGFCRLPIVNWANRPQGTISSRDLQHLVIEGFER